MLIRAEKRRRDEGKNIRGWYLRDNEWKKSTGTEKDDFKSEYCVILMRRVSIDIKRAKWLFDPVFSNIG